MENCIHCGKEVEDGRTDTDGYSICEWCFDIGLGSQSEVKGQMNNSIKTTTGKRTSIKREIQEFGTLVSQAAYLTENKLRTTYSENFSPELAGILMGVGFGVIEVSAMYTVFAGMSGAEIMSALAVFGFAGAAGGIASIVLAVPASAVLVGALTYRFANQKKLKRELERLFKESYRLERELGKDEREIVLGLLKAIQDYREKLKEKHSYLREIKEETEGNNE